LTTSPAKTNLTYLYTSPDLDLNFCNLSDSDSDS
jgi:hypothetical protein